jgi:phospholipase C
MRTNSLRACALLVSVALTLTAPTTVLADGDLSKVNHIIVVMQENHSFDNYFGALAYAPESPYHPAAPGGCKNGDHHCVDGLTCRVNAAGALECENSNLDDDRSLVKAFHDPSRCVIPDLNHGWFPVHLEANFNNPNAALSAPLMDGFVRVNDATDQPDNGVEGATEDQTMGFYTQDDLPFYFDLAQKFAIDDRYFSSVLGPTFPNRSYFMAATSFGHVTTADTVPPPGGYKPITGTIFDLLDRQHVTWADYFQDAPQGAGFRPFSATTRDPHFLPLLLFLAQAAGVPGAGTLPQVSFVDPNFGLLSAGSQSDEHPPTDIQRGQAFVSTVINAVRNGPFWKDSVIFITYDDSGGFYDHVAPPPAPQGNARTPDGISPGQCADLSNPPASLQPGGGAECAVNPLSTTDTSVLDAEALCPALADNPTGPYPQACASFDQLGFRVPLMVVSPFAKAHYVSHTVGDHTSLLAFIEERFLTVRDTTGTGEESGDRLHLTRRDQHASALQDLFDFDGAPSANTPVGQARPPLVDCTPLR